VDGFWWAFVASIIMAVFNSMIEDLTKDKDRR
jgi:uncharacterized membrane protein YvlD (DUF360 family)